MTTAFQPESFGRYFLVDKIAVGGMAEVFKAKSFSHGGFEKLLVVKRILPHLSDNIDFVEMFIDEAKISVELQHPNIVQIYDFGKLRDNYFLAMEYVEGKDVKGILRKLAEHRKLLPTEYAVYIGHEMCKGLDYAHKKTDLHGRPLGIVHRDISPSNILVSYNGDVKIADFGIAKAAISAYNTHDGVLKGKFEYMSPEQARGRDIDLRSDVFATGIILHEMLTGRRLFKTDSEIKTLEKIKAVDIEAPSALNPAIPARLDEIVMRALAREVDDRYQDAKELQNALLEYMYPSTPDLTRESLSHFMRELFKEEIAAERVRLEEGTRIAAELWEQTPELELDEEWEESPGSAQTLETRRGRLGLFVAMAIILLLGGGLVFLATREPQTKVVEKVIREHPTTAGIHLVVRPGQNATAYLNGKVIGHGAQVAYDDITPGKPVTVRVEAPGHQPFEDTVTIKAGETLRLPVTLQPLEQPKPVRPTVEKAPASADKASPAALPPAVATARFTSSPSGAQVYIDGRLVGTTPMSWTDGVPGSSHQVEYRHPGYEPTTFTARIPDAGQTENFTKNLKQEAAPPGKVSVNVKSGWAEVYIDGLKIDTTPLYNHKLSAGAHVIRVRNPQTGLDQSKTVTISSGELTRVIF